MKLSGKLPELPPKGEVKLPVTGSRIFSWIKRSSDQGLIFITNIPKEDFRYSVIFFLKLKQPVIILMSGIEVFGM